MTKPVKTKTILIAGAYIKSDAYQNVKYRISALANHPNITIKEISCNFLNVNDRTNTNKIKLLFCHILSFLKIIFICKNKILYIAYPAIFFQYLVSYLPNSLKPTMTVIDAFISIYDTAVIDRNIINVNSWKSKLLYHIEKRSFESSDYIIVDTEINREYYSDLFKIDPDKIVSIPLATNEDDFQPSIYTPGDSNICRVLFIGTLIPLHGIETIVKAAKILKENKNIMFHVIGNGQESYILEKYFSEKPNNLTWDKEWCSSNKLNNEIKNSDICLGIFGSTPKTQRVCPYKIFHYARVGRAIITSETEWTKSISKLTQNMPFSLIKPNDSNSLSEKIIVLSNSIEKRKALAEESQNFYKEYLSNQQSTEKFIKIFK